MKRCIACGMPMETPDQHAMNDTSKNYCIHCARPDGTMQSFAEKQKNLTAFIIRTQGLDPKPAGEAASSMMKKLPAWKQHFTNPPEEAKP